MGAGVIIDDGGSTRIKSMMEVGGEPIVGKMKTIMTVLPENGTGRGKSTQLLENDFYTKVRIVQLDKFGNHSPQDIDFPVNFSLRISSYLEQKVEVKNTSAGLQISLSGTSVEPIVEARQHRLMRRYIVLNSGQIEKIIVIDDKQVERVLYDIAVIPPLLEDKPVYTSVFLVPERKS